MYGQKAPKARRGILLFKWTFFSFSLRALLRKSSRASSKLGESEGPVRVGKRKEKGMVVFCYFECRGYLEIPE